MATVVGGLFDTSRNNGLISAVDADIINSVLTRFNISEASAVTVPPNTSGPTYITEQNSTVTTTRGTTTNMVVNPNETIPSGTATSTIVMGSGDTNIVTETSSGIIIVGGAGSDSVIGGAGDDINSGFTGDDIVSGNGLENSSSTPLKGNYFNGMDGDDYLVSGNGADTLIGGTGNDRLISGAGDDLLVTGVGNDTVDGGSGFDIAEMSGRASDYRITTTNGRTLVSHATNGTTDISNVQYVQLDNGQALVFAGSTQQAAITTLYQTAFGRTAEAAGLQYWFDRAAAGVSLDQIAKEFTASAEYANTAGKLDDSAFIHALYQNTLGRTAEEAGHAYWLHALTHGGATRDQLIKSFASIAAQHIDGSLQGEVNIVGSVTIIEGII